jgi:hypothetical protein
MTEFLFTIAIFALAALGLGLGLMFGRDPISTSCSAKDKSAKGRCADCPLRRMAAQSEVS